MLYVYITLCLFNNSDGVKKEQMMQFANRNIPQTDIWGKTP